MAHGRVKKNFWHLLRKKIWPPAFCKYFTTKMLWNSRGIHEFSLQFFTRSSDIINRLDM